MGPRPTLSNRNNQAAFLPGGAQLSTSVWRHASNRHDGEQGANRTRPNTTTRTFTSLPNQRGRRWADRRENAINILLAHNITPEREKERERERRKKINKVELPNVKPEQIMIIMKEKGKKGPREISYGDLMKFVVYLIYLLLLLPLFISFSPFLLFSLSLFRPTSRASSEILNIYQFLSFFLSLFLNGWESCKESRRMPHM